MLTSTIFQESTFYAEGLSKYSQKDFENAGYGGDIRDRVSEIGNHEKNHVSFLSGALTSLGQKPVAAGTYNL